MAAFAGFPGFKAYFSVKTNYESGVPPDPARPWARAPRSRVASTSRPCAAPGSALRTSSSTAPARARRTSAQAIDFGVHLINVERESELQLIDRLARERRRVVKVGVRIDPVVKNPSYGTLISTYKQKFGFPVNQSGPVFELAKRCKNVEVVGLNAHIGSQITAPRLYATNLNVLFELAARLRSAGHHHLRDQPRAAASRPAA